MDAPREKLSSTRITDWENYRALREQWVHEDDLVHYRMIWLILSQGLLLTSYDTLSANDARWIALGVPFFGLALAALIGTGIYAALASAAEIGRRYKEAGGPSVPGLAPDRRVRARGDWATRALPFIFGALWLLAFVAALGW